MNYRGKVASWGLGAALLGAFFGWPVGAALNLGADHFKPTFDRQMYHLLAAISGHEPDRVVMYQCDWATSGNIVTLQNQLNVGSSAVRVENDFQVIAVSFDGVRHDIPQAAGSVKAASEFGEIAVFRSGFYTYESSQKDPVAEQNEKFTFHLANAKGVRDDIDLEVLVYDTNQTANAMADYGNQTKGPNSLITGTEAYQTALTDGAMMMGWEGNDVISGSDASDSIFTWTGSDQVRGLGGDDYLSGERGPNRLEGGLGADMFVAHSDKLENVRNFDTIVDFSPAEGDVLELSAPLRELWGEEPPSPLELFWVEAEKTHFDIFLRGETGETVSTFHVARLLANKEFVPESTNIADLVQAGTVQY
ncbi:MAG: calcium-binding protein [Rhodobacteraceae bacterium]|nr:calcium-binding protein [Paracoccaceae bacterium]